MKSKISMVEIPGGSFLMGSNPNDPDKREVELPQHEVTISPFFMGVYPITQRQYKAVMKNNPSYFKAANRPVENVSWDDAVEFCRRLSKRECKSYRLPSEAEWEYACRAGTNTRHYFGDIVIEGKINNLRESTSKVGSFHSNNFGLYDMIGNVWEWCEDYWHDDYENAPIDGSAWITDPPLLKKRVMRGGSWVSNEYNCRSASRITDWPEAKYNCLGFRIACSEVNQ